MSVRIWRRWTPLEVEALEAAEREGLDIETTAARLPGRSPAAIRTHRNRLGIGQKGPSRRSWRTSEINRLRVLVAARMTAVDIAAELGRTVFAVQGKCHVLGLDRPRANSASRSSPFIGYSTGQLTAELEARGYAVSIVKVRASTKETA